MACLFARHHTISFKRLIFIKQVSGGGRQNPGGFLHSEDGTVQQQLPAGHLIREIGGETFPVFPPGPVLAGNQGAGVSLIRMEHLHTVADPDFIPDYSGQDVLELNDNKPSFTDEEIASITGEHFSELDGLGRCGTVYAMLHRSMMPTGKRGSISEIRPSGWKQKKYPGIVDSDPPYLWNRSHLIAYGMTGQTANERNLITGSRYMNATTMLPYEESVMWYLHGSNNHVLYRVTPFFKGSELVARGVEMEAYSVEDHGRGVSFHVFVYNVQPGIGIDYRTGESWQE